MSATKRLESVEILLRLAKSKDPVNEEAQKMLSKALASVEEIIGSSHSSERLRARAIELAERIRNQTK